MLDSILQQLKINAKLLHFFKNWENELGLVAHSQVWLLRPVISVTWEVEIGRIMV
jgi:hypothetical protein